MRLVLLGTGNPNPDPERSGPSTAVVYKGRAYVVDAGPGVVRRCRSAFEKGTLELRPDRLTRLFLTHLHSDHTTGLPDLILTPWVMERKEPLCIWGPPGTKRMCKNILDAYEEDIRVRKKGLEKANEVGIQLKINETGTGRVFQENGIVIKAFKTEHGAWKHSFGYRFETGERTFVISGDCRPSEDLVERYRGADILLHEAYSSKGFQELPDKWKRYHESSHTSGKDLARMANEVRPGLLVLHHTLLWGASEKDLLDEIKEEYSGEVMIGEDLQVI